MKFGLEIVLALLSFGFGYFAAEFVNVFRQSKKILKPICTAGLCNCYQLMHCGSGLCAHHHKEKCYDHRMENFLCSSAIQPGNVVWIPRMKDPPRS